MSNDRVTLREIMSLIKDAMAEPDPAQELAEALRNVISAWTDGTAHIFHARLHEARAALAKWEAA